MFKDDHWSTIPDCVHGALEHLKFSALHINLDEPDWSLLGHHAIEPVRLDEDFLNVLVRSVISSLTQPAITGIAYNVLKRRGPCGIAQGAVIEQEVCKASECLLQALV